MSATEHDPSFDSGHHHLAPALAAMAIVVATVAIALFFTGLPH